MRADPRRDRPQRLGRRTRGLAVLSLASLLVFPAACRKSRFPPRGDAAAVVVVARRGDAATVPKLAEQEPNDSPERAQLLGIALDQTLSFEGALVAAAGGSGTDVDMVKLVVPAEPAVNPSPAPVDGAVVDPRAGARRLAVEVAAEGSPVALQFLDEAAKPAAGISVEAGETGGMPNLAVLPGQTYYLRIKATKPAKPAQPPVAAEAARYRLTVQLADFEVADEREPNDSRETANPVDVVGTAECAGYHGWARDLDFFRIPLPEVPSVLDVDVSAVENVGASVQVVEANGARLAFGKGRRAERLALRNVTVQPAAADAPAGARFVYVAVRAETGQNRTQRYVVRFSLGAPREDTEVEPNDAPERATLARDGNTVGFLQSGDVDHFRYQSDGPRDVSLAVTFPARVRGKLAAWREGEAEPVAKSEAKKPRQRLELPRFSTGGSPVIVRVSALKSDGNASDAYTLNIGSLPTSNLQPSAAPSPVPPPRIPAP